MILIIALLLMVFPAVAQDVSPGDIRAVEKRWHDVQAQVQRAEEAASKAARDEMEKEKAQHAGKPRDHH